MKKNNKWTKEAVLCEALKFHSKIEWKKASASSYKKARESGWIVEASAHMSALWEKKWDKDLILKEAKKYKTRSEWLQKSPNSYQAAQRLKINKEASTHMEWVSHRNKWNQEAIEKEMSKYSSVSEWAKKSQSSYEAAKRLNIKSNHKRLWEKKWDKQSVFKSAKEYENVTAWLNCQPGAYKAAVALGAMEEAIAHMKVLGGRSTAENDIMKTIKEKYPKAQRISMANKDPKFYPAKRFHLDIYIPELRKGIEFDGDYWHSLSGLKRGRPTWSSEEVASYHYLKDSFFEHKGIKILHIKEKEWNSNKDYCINKILGFLKNGE